MSIEIININKNYGNQKALNQINFNIPEGEIVGFLGPNGAGKSTLMKIITGFIPPDEGKVKICGYEINEFSYKIRQLVGYLPEHNPLYLDMYVKEYLSFVAGLYHLKNKNTRVADMIEVTGLSVEKHKKIGALSKGYRQRVGLAQALLPDPDVLILDEPTTGLDPNQIIEVRELIKNLGKEKTILLSTHIMQEVKAICERVIIIHKGNIVADNEASKLTTKTVSNEQSIHIEFATSVPIDTLKQVKSIDRINKIGQRTYQITSNSKEDIRPELFRLAVANNLVILTLAKDDQSLEDVFHSLTNDSGS